MTTDEAIAAQVKARDATIAAIVASTAPRRLVIAGPGTGKTFLFKEVLRAAQGGLALTFIKILADELDRSLTGIASASTLHGYGLGLAHDLGLPGLTRSFDVYPALPEIVAVDVGAIRDDAISADALCRKEHDMDEADGIIDQMMELGTYYDAVSYEDIVYRVLKHLREVPELTPVQPLIVVDEYQDFSRMESEFIQVLSERSPTLIAGDDDQALYVLKPATARYLRQLASDNRYERHELPFCSRCTAVVVHAVNDIVAAAVNDKHLKGRISKPFECFLPDKAADSRAHPDIVHVVCSTDTARSPYPAMYIEKAIGAIPASDISQSRGEGWLTALVIGPRHFVKRAHEIVSKSFPQSELRLSKPRSVELLDGYIRLAKARTSRLGWRILVHAGGVDQTNLAAVLAGNHEIADLFSGPEREYHEQVADLVQKVRASERLEPAERSQLESAAGMALGDIEKSVFLAERPEPLDAALPTIVFTTFHGSKGLSASYVYVVGFNDMDFPRNPRRISDDEICQLLVALSRTRLECTLLSSRRYGEEWRTPSTFVGWINQPVRQVTVNKDSW